MPGISFVIVNYYTSNLVKKLISSINNVDEGSNVEIIVIDNTTNEKAKFKSRIDNVRIHHTNNNLGFGCACNIGAKLASKENLVFINPDSLLFQNDSIKLLNKSFCELPGNTIFTGRILDRNQQPVCNTFRFSNFINIYFHNSVDRVFGNSIPLLSNKVEVYLKDRSYEVDWVSGAFLCIKKKFFFELGGFDENIFMYEEDADLCYRAKKSNGKVLFIPGLYIIHYGGEASKNNNELLTFIGLKSTLYFYRKRNNGLKAILLEHLISLTWSLIYYLHILLSPVFPSLTLKRKKFWKTLGKVASKNKKVPQQDLITYLEQ